MNSIQCNAICYHLFYHLRRLQHYINLIEKQTNESTVLFEYPAQTMQHAVMHLRRLRHTLDRANIAFLANQFRREGSLNISNHLPYSSFA